ncbi:MAG: hypothetical protein FJZ01_18265 [Candidatus Sericytochromatia bacterium]|nr:hypothetical protein [Candidatus Tanganyikabacteria bacterium]
MQDLVQPGTQAIFVPVGTILSAEVIMKIRQAGLEDLALECIANKKKALHAGINLKRFDPRAVLTATELAQMRAERLVDSAIGLRAVMWMLLLSATVFALVVRSPQFMMLTGLLYLGLVGAYAVTGAIAEGHKRQIIALKNQEHRDAEEKRSFLNRVTQGDPEAVAEVVQEGVVGKGRVLMLEIEHGFIVIHVVMRDSLEVAGRAGIELGPPPPGRDLAATQSLRIATSDSVGEVLEAVAEILAGIFSFSPSTQVVAISLFDPFEEPRSRQKYLGCLAAATIDRYQFESLAKEGNPALALGRWEGLQLVFDRNGPFGEVPPASYAGAEEAALEF